MVDLKETPWIHGNLRISRAALDVIERAGRAALSPTWTANARFARIRSADSVVDIPFFSGSSSAIPNTM
jgi:hypothetical protein